MEEKPTTTTHREKKKEKNPQWFIEIGFSDLYYRKVIKRNQNCAHIFQSLYHTHTQILHTKYDVNSQHMIKF